MSSSPPDPSQAIPQANVILSHLEHLFGDIPASIEGLIEYGWTAGNDPRHPLNQARLLDCGGFDQAAHDIAQLNEVEFQNGYVGLGLRRPDASRSHRAKADDTTCLVAIWADLDSVGSPTHAIGLLSAVGLQPTLVVQTGEHPHLRVQMVWKLETPTQELGRAKLILRRLADLLGGDRSVCNVDRLLRVAGTVAWPIKPGRVPELTRLRLDFATRVEPYTLDEIERRLRSIDLLLGGPSEGQSARPTQDERLRKSKTPHSWHDNVRDHIAHEIQAGLGVEAIVDSAERYRLKGYSLEDTERDVRKMAEGAVIKFAPKSAGRSTQEHLGVGGAALLDAVQRFISRFVSYPDVHASVAHALWIAHTYLLDRVDTSPRLLFRSPEPGSGKTRALEVTELLAQRPILTVNASPAYIFRRIDDEGGRPTLLHDEIDAVFGSKAADHEDLRALLNSGYRRGATVGRVMPRGNTFVLQDFSAYCAVALAGLGDLPDTIMSRAVDIQMRRRRSDERIEAFRHRDAKREASHLRDRLEAWTDSIAPRIGQSWPEMPLGVEDRNADNWEALLAVADAAGGTWPERARAAAEAFVTRAREADRQSLGIRLLADVRQVFGERQQMSTADLLTALNGLEDAPWADLRGKQLDARGLARRLGKFDVRKTTVRTTPNSTAKGYRREDLHDAWVRYLTPQE